MALFQNAVLQKHLKLQDASQVDKAYSKFTKYFHDRKRQVNIRDSKEEQFQEGFLRELFVKILGYTLNPEPNFDLTTELKNEKNAKKTDGAILKDGNALAVIELKSTKTKDLGLVQEQAFNYKANQTGCIYVITSNFEKVRFYVNNAVDYEEFNLFTLSKEDFAFMYLCLHKDNLLKNVPLTIKNDSIVEEEKITKKFYADYSLFKRELYRDLVKQNVKNEVFRSELQREDSERGTKNIKLNLFKKSQKLIDRFLFIFFAEDRGLLSPNSTLQILDQWQRLKDDDAYFPLYERFKVYFNYLDTGRAGTNQKAEIFAYNGGLFKPDTILDSLKINDELLYKHAKILSRYDFDSQVDVNILGHIFENSLNEIESVNAEIEGGDFDKQKTKRKKDGVFYTPKYITKYIVDNTVGKLCTEKRAEIGIVEEDYVDSRQKETKKKLLENLKAYREWLLQITICDPACGSGAFLNQALDFLIYEHNNLDALETSLLGGMFVFPNIENTVLENNIFGVDLNEESVEIAKLSLWLRTAQPRRKLNDLNSNIQCGNSLIDDKKVAGDKAFNWQESFPKVFKTKDKQAFHIVLTTHNSRTSARMISQNVIKGEARELGLEEEIALTQIIGNIIKEKNYNCIAYNICKDHLHLVIVCAYEELTEIIKTIKGKSSFLLNKGLNDDNSNGFQPITSLNKGLKPLGGNDISNGTQPIANKALWSQKFYSVATNTWELETLSTKAGYIYNDSHFDNVLPYIQTNREKHGLPFSKELNQIIKSFVISQDDAFKMEHSGGFDVVIGNPPYVQLQKMKELSLEIAKLGYETYESTGDLYCLFYEKGTDILKQNGVLGFITSNKWMRANYGKSLRKYLFENTTPYKLLDLGAGIFESAVVDSNIVMYQKLETNNFNIPSLDITKEKNVQDLMIYESQFVSIFPKNDDAWAISSKIEQRIKSKIEKVGTELKKWDIPINIGVKSGLTEAFIIDKNKKDELIKQDPKASEIIKPVLRGRDVKRYQIDFQELYLINTHNGYKDIAPINNEEFPSIKEYLETFEPKLSKRGDKGKTPFNLRNCAYLEDFSKANIFYPDIAQKLSFVYSDNNYTITNTGYFLRTDDKYLLVVLNSKLINYYYKTISAQLGKSGIRLFTIYIEKIPIPIIQKKEPFIEKADFMLNRNKNFQKIDYLFQNYLQQKFQLEKLSKKLQNWYELDFGEFIKELNKAIKAVNKERAKAQVIQGDSSPCNETETNNGLKPIGNKTMIPTLSKLDEMDWMEVFESKKAEAQALKTQIDQTDKEIDHMVYQLYNLTEEEIEIVENS